MVGILVSVGRNPLPVAVAVSRLIKKYAGARLTFIASRREEVDRIISTLQPLFGGRLTYDVLKLGDPKDPEEIRKHIEEYLRTGPFEEIHFHYTGGTKVMVLHVIRALDYSRGTPVTVSYLGAEESRLIGSARSAQFQASVIGAPDERQQFALSIEQLANVHGYTLNYEVCHPSYIAGAVKRRGGKPALIPNPRQVPSPKTLALSKEFANIRMHNRNATDLLDKAFRQNWFPDRDQDASRRWPQLPKRDKNQISIQWPAGVQPSFPGSMNTALGYTVWNAAGTFDPPDDVQLEEICKWFLGNWLEDHVFGAFTNVLSCKEPINISLGVRFAPLQFLDRARTQQTKVSKDFELDVAVVLGYQLIAVSCYAGASEQTAKQKGFEAIHRARQLGGGEALAVLVCLLDTGRAYNVFEELNAEARTFNVPLRVWGRSEVSNLQDPIVQMLREIEYI